jgi:hypothetical protein
MYIVSDIPDFPARSVHDCFCFLPTRMVKVALSALAA